MLDAAELEELEHPSKSADAGGFRAPADNRGMAENSDVVEMAKVKTEKLLAELEAQLEAVKKMLDDEFGNEEKLAS